MNNSNDQISPFFEKRKEGQLEKKLEFEQIRELVSSFCISNLGRKLVDKIQFQTSFAKIDTFLRQTEEFRQILLMENSFPSQNYFDLSDELIRLKIEGTYIEQALLFQLKLSLKTIYDCVKFLAKDEEIKYPFLHELALQVKLQSEILPYSNKLIDDKGDIYDNASETLASLRKEIARKRISIDQKISKILGTAKKEGWVNAEAETTIRNGRLVIPVLDTHRRKIKGFIHDESATRQTAYIEPAEIVEINNALRELEFAEHREIIRILTEFTSFIRPHIGNLLQNYLFLGRLDFTRAKALFALQIQAVMPILTDKPFIYWLDARHPLLYLALQKQKKEVVPLHIELNVQQRIVIISGPNAGGKSVCLKTIGLLQYMLQCGLLVPTRETSEFGVFSHVFIDIGDEQSIENDLSTYSSHLLNMKNLLKEAGKQTLFLIDELGTGTEPRVGGAIAEAMLEELNIKGSYGIVTTHYANLKLLADHKENIVNAAMLFDTQNMRPLYQLSIGKPGSSFAFEIAKKIGLPKNILDNAVQKAGSTILDFETQLQEIEVEKLNLRKKETEIKIADELLAEIIEKYTSLNENLENQKREIIQRAKLQAKEIISGANKQIENTIAQIKKTSAEKTATQEARIQLNTFLHELEEGDVSTEKIHLQTLENKKQKRNQAKIKNKKEISFENQIFDEPIKVGDIVQIGDENNFAEAIKITAHSVQVVNSSIKMSLPLDFLKKTSKKNIPSKEITLKSKYGSIFESINERKAHFSPSIDVRGKRAEDALADVKQLIDDALLLSEKNLRILHGKGNGILKQLIRQFLQNETAVKSFESEHVDRGGDGITLVLLK